MKMIVQLSPPAMVGKKRNMVVEKKRNKSGGGTHGNLWMQSRALWNKLPAFLEVPDPFAYSNSAT
jgi:hypothetical protein